MKYLHKLLFITGNKFRGYNALQRIDQLKRMENWPLDRIEAWQLYKLKNLLKHAYYNVPFYYNHWSKAGIKFSQIRTIKDLRLLPKVTKEDLRKAGDQALDSSRNKNKFLKQSSSGSTGEPFIYYMDKNLVLVFGNFNIVHPGHLRLLNFAKGSTPSQIP